MHTDCTKTQAHTRKRKIDVWQGKEAKRKAEGRQRAERSGRKKKRVGNPAWRGEKKGGERKERVFRSPLLHLLYDKEIAMQSYTFCKHKGDDDQPKHMSHLTKIPILASSHKANPQILDQIAKSLRS